MFSLQVPDPDWLTRAPVRIARELHLEASPAAVFAVLCDHASWPSWFKGMRRTRVDGAAAGAGALRTVWVGATRVQERFLVWEPDARLSFAVVASNVPGLRAMLEDWRLEPETGGSKLSITIGTEGAGIFAHAPGLVKAVVAASTTGAAGITSVFTPPGGAG